MQYRTLGRIGNVSALGFGAMRLPVANGKVDEKEAIAMIRAAIDAGVTYVDTAYPYHNGESEVVVGKALGGGYRHKVMLATKLPVWHVREAADFDRYLDEQLGRMRQDRVDVYLLHSLNKTSWPKVRDLGVLDWAERAVASGRVGHIGFSFHDDADTFRSIVDAYDWEICQVQYNIMDVDNQAGTAGVRYAAGRGVAVVVMEPLLGGKLVAPPAPVQALWDGSPSKRSPVAWALEWLWSQPEVSLVLSGMSTMEQVKDNLAIADRARVGGLSAADLALCDRVRACYRGLNAIPCTACGYCMPCPHGVDIPANLAAYNEGLAYGHPDAARGQYAWWKTAFEVAHIQDHDIRAAQCTACKTCEKKCPQKIPISAWMKVIHAALGENGPYVRSLPA
ncbi:MAG TPA: aldo/keto reductase [Spirochaetia bacterium]